jgi:NAD(P)H-hydrate epimerase
MRYVTADEMKAIDKYTIEKRGAPAALLMENAGKAVAQEVWKLSPRGEAAVFCGYGNNGGDGFVAARYLIEKGCSVKVFLAGRPKPLKTETETNFKKLVDMKNPPLTLTGEEDIDRVFSEIRSARVIIDALFGIGMKGRLESFYVELVNRINAFGAPVISVDIPSGLDADTGKPLPVAVKAFKTVTFGFPKIGFRSQEAKNYTGEVMIADIGLAELR